MLDALPPCCAAANDLVRRTRRDLTCDCGERYLYDERTAERPALVPEAPAVEQVAPRRPSMPGAQRDARVQVADEQHLRPSNVASASRERVTSIDDPELVEVRGFLCWLRPEARGPFGWPPDGDPPPPSDVTSEGRPILGALAGRMRVQTSVVVPSILPGAFASEAGVTRAPLTTPGTVRYWLQRHGTLKRGLRALYEACADALAPPDVRAKWKTLPPPLAVAARPGWGRRAVLDDIRGVVTVVDPDAARVEALEDRVEALHAAARSVEFELTHARRRLTGDPVRGDLNDIPAPEAVAQPRPDSGSP